MSVSVFRSVNPYNQTIVGEYTSHTSKDVIVFLQKAEKAYNIWKKHKTRARLFDQLAQKLARRKEELATLITLEMGKLLAESRAEVEKSIELCRFYANHAEEMLAPLPIERPKTLARIYHQPTGCVLGIMPWNFPIWQTLRYAVPTLCAGNVTILKLAPNTMGCATFLEEIFMESGFPEGVFQNLRIDVSLIEQIIASPIVSGVTLTGSSRAGASVASIAGKYIKKTVLELGGSDAFLVDETADIQTASKIAAQSRLLNAGQSCIAAKRFIVHQAVLDDFTKGFLKHLSTVQLGNPLESDTTLAPLARPDLLNNINHQYQTSIQKKGVEILLSPKIEGNFFTPAVLTGDNITQTPACQEETFGALAVIIVANHQEEMIKIANQTPYGLGCTIFTKTKESWLEKVSDIEVGQVSFNNLLRSDWSLPFGGIKQSGYGRELGTEGLREFTNIQTVIIENI